MRNLLNEFYQHRRIMPPTLLVLAAVSAAIDSLDVHSAIKLITITLICGSMIEYATRKTGLQALTHPRRIRIGVPLMIAVVGGPLGAFISRIVF